MIFVFLDHIDLLFDVPFLTLIYTWFNHRSLKFGLYITYIDSKPKAHVVMTRSETKLSVAIPAPVSGQLAVNVKVFDNFSSTL